MRCPVLWVSRHPEILARGYADEGLLEALLRRDLWTPPDPIQFDHHEAHGDAWPQLEGALVVLPARHHATPADVDWFCARLDELQWALVILAGDEEWAFPWQRVSETPRRRVWTMQPVPGHESLSWRLPGGWYPGTDTAVARYPERAASRPLDWMFAGQVTHERRHLCVDVLRDLPAGLLYETDGYLRGMPQTDYWRHLAGAKVVPSPSGPCTVDTARPLEALEAGAVPVVDMLRPGDVRQFDYWHLCFGSDADVLPRIINWGDFPERLATILEHWPAPANACSAWWQGWKRTTALKLDEHLRDVAQQPAHPTRPSALVTAIVTTSPIPSHPDTSVLEETVASIRDQLPDAEILIVCDGVRPEQLERADQYSEYVRRVCWLAEHQWRNVLPIVSGEWLHQVGCTRLALEQVHTPLVLFVEHDTPLVGSIDWQAVTAAVLSGEANAIRFHHETTVLPVHENLMLDPFTVTLHGAAFRRTSAWWQRPHVASTRFYRDRIMPLFAPQARTFIEDVLYGIIHSAVRDHGEAAWWDWRVYIYAPPGESIKRSTHLDGRDSDPKFPLLFAYPDEPPAGAPRPSVSTQV